MALIDRVKERTKTTLSDPELNELIADASNEIEDRYGAVGAPITDILPGGFVSIVPSRRVVEITGVTERSSGSSLVLGSSDFRVVDGGRRIERLATGANPRSAWADEVEVVYDPLDDQKQRDEVIVKLVILSINYEGVKSDNIDGYTSSHLDFDAERETLLCSLDRSVKLA